METGDGRILPMIPVCIYKLFGEKTEVNEARQWWQAPFCSDAL